MFTIFKFIWLLPHTNVKGSISHIYRYYEASERTECNRRWSCLTVISWANIIKFTNSSTWWKKMHNSQVKDEYAFQITAYNFQCVVILLEIRSNTEIKQCTYYIAVVHQCGSTVLFDKKKRPLYIYTTLKSGTQSQNIACKGLANV